jgi:cytochrome c peroxidase
MRDLAAPAIIVASMTLAVLAWDELRPAGDRTGAGADAVVLAPRGEPIQPLPRSLDLDPRKVALGERLFRDPWLSRDGTVACASCHSLALGGADGRRTAVGIDGKPGELNTPTVLNSGLSFRQFWDGRVRTLEEQVDGPLKSPVEMGSNWELVIGRLAADEAYSRAFATLYPEGLSDAAVRDAIATFERSLITPNARFDRHLRGEQGVLTVEERTGYELFKSYGCVGCHQGVGIGGNMYQRLGIVRDYFAERGDLTRADLGRFNVTGREVDRHVFKVPSLRNVALTAPYFHDGSAATLEDAIRVMARFQLGREVPDADVTLLAAFLHSLTGDAPGAS